MEGVVAQDVAVGEHTTLCPKVMQEEWHRRYHYVQKGGENERER